MVTIDFHEIRRGEETVLEVSERKVPDSGNVILLDKAVEFVPGVSDRVGLVVDACSSPFLVGDVECAWW